MVTVSESLLSQLSHVLGLSEPVQRLEIILEEGKDPLVIVSRKVVAPGEASEMKQVWEGYRLVKIGGYAGRDA